MAYILNIETATKNCSVAIAKDGATLLCKEIAAEGYSHAEKLHVFIEEILAETHLKFNDLNAIAVSQGPGSYTGLRIGVSAAKGLCYALNIPLIAIDTLQVLALRAKVNSGLIIPMIDARRMEVYSAIFDAKYQKTAAVKAEVITQDSYAGTTEPVRFVSDCPEKLKTVLTKSNFTIEEMTYPSADDMAGLSFDKYKISDTVDVAYFEPYYLKDFFLQKSQ